MIGNSNKYFQVFMLFLISFASYAQSQNQKRSNGVPEEIVIRDGYVAGYVFCKHDTIDFNRDGLADFVF
jgi:hypothetical protein